MSRRSLTPTAARIPGLLPQRRSIGGARVEATDRVHLTLGSGVGGDGISLEGWALNVSRGGIRLIVDGASIEGAQDGSLPLAKLLELGRVITTSLGEEPPREGRIVWIQEEPDGAVIGVAFADAPTDSGVPPPIEDPASQDARASKPDLGPSPPSPARSPDGTSSAGSEDDDPGTR